ncbi:hypothetical protein BDY21DRAFT_366259 [Lineolata rhizophorae]|uniref:Uncharacterized protein n=1 Tax=Lineolata rhizophorae TaxID=578093 RepID=A0A6A6NSM3_9PEZI|nr:hypothetical protein BDY21DRAFT_366259 [Lineolata rhizophorae]
MSSTMDSVRHLVIRATHEDEGFGLTDNPTVTSLLIALLVLTATGILLVGALFILRHVHQEAKQHPPAAVRPSSNHRRLTITAAPYGRRSESIYVYQERQNLMDNSSSPPASPVPEIRITFPEEVDESTGKRQSGRMVVVRVGEHGGVGLEPVHEDLPPYQQSDSSRFQSLDLNRIGGLKEKESEKRWS